VYRVARDARKRSRNDSRVRVGIFFISRTRPLFAGASRLATNGRTPFTPLDGRRTTTTIVRRRPRDSSAVVANGGPKGVRFLSRKRNNIYAPTNAFRHESPISNDFAPSFNGTKSNNRPFSFLVFSYGKKGNTKNSLFICRDNNAALFSSDGARRPRYCYRPRYV